MEMSEEDYACMSEDFNAGYCSDCDEIVEESGVEPDARNYKCPKCGAMTMMGLEQAMVAGHIEIMD
jgi:predicted RNA-binding Zn-ribbon protein involved in translation (DUF1610 family)